jgi:hypothetical protein
MNKEAKRRLLDGLNACRGGQPVEGTEEILVRVIPDRGELAREFAPERDAVAELIRERGAED